MLYHSLFVIFSFLILPSYSSNVKKCTSQMKSGDVVFFLDPETEGFSDAVANSYHSKDSVTHVGLFSDKEGKKAIHALPGIGVTEHNFEKLSSIFFKTHGHIVVKRYNIDDFNADEIVSSAHRYIGFPYNDIFSDNNLNSKGEFSFYCSQFIEQIYNEAIGSEVFQKHPMSFHNADGNEIPYWKSYFASRNLPVPEGDIGTHPGSLYESDKFLVVCSAELSQNQQEDEL